MLTSVRRKGEISLERVKREWSHHVAISADKVMGNGYDILRGFADNLAVGPRTYHIRRDDVDFVVFKETGHAALFQNRFNGERLEWRKS